MYLFILLLSKLRCCYQSAHLIVSKGCGKGYDVAMLALHGFDAYGLEISAAGVAAAERYAAMEMKRPQDYNFGDADGDGSKGLVPDGTVSFIEGDFFNRDWESSKGDLAADVDVDVDGRFDVIYDYTASTRLLST